MKKINWNLGIAVINIGYKIRKYNFEPEHFNLRWIIGVSILRFGYDLRGDIPQKTWAGNHI